MYVTKAVSKFDCHAIKMKYMSESFEAIIHPQYGNALHVHNASIRYQAIRKRELRESCFDLMPVLGGPQKSTRRAVVCPPLF